MMSLPADVAVLESPTEELEQGNAPHSEAKHTNIPNPIKIGASRPKTPEPSAEKEKTTAKTKSRIKVAEKAIETKTDDPHSVAVLVEEIPVQEVTLEEAGKLELTEVATPVQSNPYARPIHLLNAGLSFTPYEKEWQLSPEERELVSSSISQTWTDQAMKCYMCAADCGNCDIPKGQYSFVCQMNKVVPVLLENIGQPDPHRLKRIFPQGYPHSAY